MQQNADSAQDSDTGQGQRATRNAHSLRVQQVEREAARVRAAGVVSTITTEKSRRQAWWGARPYLEKLDALSEQGCHHGTPGRSGGASDAAGNTNGAFVELDRLRDEGDQGRYRQYRGEARQTTPRTRKQPKGRRRVKRAWRAGRPTHLERDPSGA
ncbi:Nn.00g038460.m01.CDS01 [Neocucurbitaria sp. VM-36]